MCQVYITSTRINLSLTCRDEILARHTRIEEKLIDINCLSVHESHRSE